MPPCLCPGIGTIFLFPPVPAVGAELAAVQSDRFDHIVQTVIAQAGELELAADPVDHLLILGGFRIGIDVQVGILVVSLHLLNHPAGDQIHLGAGTGEV